MPCYLCGLSDREFSGGVYWASNLLGENYREVTFNGETFKVNVHIDCLEKIENSKEGDILDFNIPDSFKGFCDGCGRVILYGQPSSERKDFLACRSPRCGDALVVATRE